MNYFDVATKLHKKIGVIDVHMDLGPFVLSKKQLGLGSVIKRKYLESFKNGSLKLITAVIFIDTAYVPEMALKLALMQIEAIYEDLEGCDEFVIATNGEQLKKGLESGKIVVIFSLEGLEPIGNELYLLKAFRRLGVMAAGLTWNRRNFVADGCGYSFGDGKRTEGGLTEFGVSVISEMEKLGMIVDVSHLNDVGFWDVARAAKRPFIASHSGSRAVFNSPRNLTDEMACAVVKSGGIIGVCGVDILLCEKNTHDRLGMLCKHILHFVKLVGAKHVGLGLDMCDEMGLTSLPYEGNAYDHDIIKSHDKVYLLTERLLLLGLSEEEVGYILGQSFVEFFERFYYSDFAF